MRGRERLGSHICRWPPPLRQRFTSATLLHASSLVGTREKEYWDSRAVCSSQGHLNPLTSLDATGAFMNNVYMTLLDEEMTKIKVLDLDQFYNFYVHDFFSWNHLLLRNIVWSCHFLKFKFWIDKTQPHEKITKIIAITNNKWVEHDFTKSLGKIIKFEISMREKDTKFHYRLKGENFCSCSWISSI